MPQFELEAVGPQAVSGLHRARSPEDAVRRAADVAENASVVVEEAEDVHGWREVLIEGDRAGRVRAHQRMRFRRD